MNLLTVIDYAQPNQAGLSEPSERFTTVRPAARAVLVDEDGGVYLIRSHTEGYYKLPGGGVEADETLEIALAREVLEETGHLPEIIAPIGQVIQYRHDESFRQDSYAYLARTLGQIQAPELTADEAAAGYQVVRLPSLTAAITALEDLRHNPDWHSMLNRELAILRAAQTLEVTI
jgi:8-oxo-dGTP diphosphatase